ncbi:sugar ABC transporter substrate-binding protein [Microbacterium capsulatum]|uniref:Sugar ABC transporter substrate-binding protein n=1 Tax=Microbacterium capsulatum TaxID=3041921 RepID=A0ABU0XPX9_9MICO|nr:sugar ABC transporter substrate-binding protein [Microbacterium sp. ASV81]MDQ4215825.1 sugar ABC transporter substrate-binding protein [Microbacterium sp. ASV81]
MKKRFGLAAAAAAVVALLLSGCTTVPDAGAAASGGGAKGDGKTVGITFSDLSNPVWSELVQEAQTYGKDKGLSVNYVDAHNDAATQVTQIENFIQQGVSAIIICAVDANALKDVTAKAQKAGIKVVGYTQVLTNYDSQYLVDAYKTGYANGEAAGKWIQKNYGDKAVEWGLMDLPRFPEIIERAKGIKDAVAKVAPNAKLVATAPALTSEDGVANAENFLQAHPNIKMIATIGGGGAVGGNEGVKSAGVTDFKTFGLFGIDATQQEIQNIMKGDPEKSTISLGGGKAHGRTLIDITKELLDGKKVEKDQYMPIKAIDSSNAKAYYDEVFGGK